jgi:hypothetical protein
MDKAIIITLFFIAFSVVIFGFIGYAVVTTKIIKSQEKEIAQLTTLLKRYKQREERKRAT